MGSYRFFQNKDCEYFPCHKIDNIEDFNCLFCFCPLYAKGEKCGGDFSITKNGVKSCMSCSRPHQRESYDYIIEQLKKDKNNEDKSN